MIEKIARLNETENYTRISRDEAKIALSKGIDITVTISDRSPDSSATVRYPLQDDVNISGQTIKDKIERLEKLTLHNGSWLSYWIMSYQFMEAFA